MASNQHDTHESVRPKRLRPLHACSLCHARKIRCDSQQGSCRNCELAGVECVSLGLQVERMGSRNKDKSRKQPRTQDLHGLARRTSSPLLPGRTRSSRPSSGVYKHYQDSISAKAGVSKQTAHQVEQPVQISSQENSQPQTNTALQCENANPTLSPNSLDPGSSLLPIGSGQEKGHENGQLAEDESLQSFCNKSSDGAFHEYNSSMRRKWLGPSSVQVFAQWLDLSLVGRGGQSLSSMFRSGMRHCEEIEIPFSMTDPAALPRLPPIHARNKYIATYLRCIQPIFPLLNENSFWAVLKRFDWLSSEEGQEAAQIDRNVPPSDRSHLVCIYAALSIGVDEDSAASTSTGEMYLKTAFSLYNHLLASPYLSSVQALLVLSIALRSRTMDGSAWHIAGHAVRAAQSLGLHRSRKLAGHEKGDLELDSRIWWTAYCLDKIMGFETGRPSAIDDDDCNQKLPIQYSGQGMGGDCELQGSDCFMALINLTQIQSKISKCLFKSKPSTDSAQILKVTGELDQSLISWLETVPPDIRPGNDIFCGPQMYSFAVFLAMQYHHTMTMLHRAGLLFDSNLLQQQIDTYCSTLPNLYRLKRSEDICVTSARAVVKLSTGNSYGCHQSRFSLSTLTPPLLAIYVLAIYILKRPCGNLVQADLTGTRANWNKLLTTEARQIESQYMLLGQDPEFCSMFGFLVDLTTQRVLGAPAAQPPTLAGNTITESDHNQHQLHHPNSSNLSYSPTDVYDNAFDEDLWSCVLGNDLALGSLGNVNQNMQAGYQFFGLSIDQEQFS